MEADVNSKSMLASQQQLAAYMAVDAAEDASQIDAAAVPDIKDALAETRGFAIEAQIHAQHAKATEKKFQELPRKAADAAAAAIREQLRSEAYAAAAQAEAKVAVEAPARHIKKVTETVAAAMEPYHIALLRSQKNAAVDEMKARIVATGARKLSDEATRLAKEAQTMQESGMGVQAMQTMSIAHSTAQQSVDMRKWAVKLHAEADKLRNTLTSYEVYEEQAAENAIHNVGVEIVPKLPTQPPKED